MPREARIVLPHYPHHIVQRGHNRRDVFVVDVDYRYYLDNLIEWKTKLSCRVYAYCLMTNHIHLIVDPGESARHLGCLMKRLAGRQTRFANKRERRSGTLWESRFKSSPVETDRYLLACCRYVEMNPVRAGLVRAPEDYPWSSYRKRAGFEDLGWLDIDPSYAAMGNDAVGRASRYREWVRNFIPSAESGLMREAVRRGQLTGDDRFIEEVSRMIGRHLGRRRPGRPVKAGCRRE